MGAPEQRIVEIQIRLMRIETVPAVRFSERIVTPVGSLKVAENDPGAEIFIQSFAPDVEVTPTGAGGGAARALEPRPAALLSKKART
jgi:hypothetical protein